MIHHVLGITWDVERDCFALGVAVKEKYFSRRGILSMPSALFDPLGFVAPVTLLEKYILNLCRKRIGWDESTVYQKPTEKPGYAALHHYVY